jgi:hypothetical protein
MIFWKKKEKEKPDSDTCQALIGRAVLCQAQPAASEVRWCAHHRWRWRKDIGAGQVGAVSNSSCVVQSRGEEENEQRRLRLRRARTMPPVVLVLPCSFSLPSLPSLRCSVCGGTTRAVAKRLEGAWARHGVELYTPCLPMARRTM